MLIVAAVLTVVAVGFAVWVTIGHDRTPSDEGIAKAVDRVTPATPLKAVLPKSPEPLKKETATPATTAILAPAGPKEDPKPVGLEPEIPKSEPKAVAEAKPEPKDDKTAEANRVAANDHPADKPEPNEQPAFAKKLVPPSAEDQKRLVGEIDEVYKPGEAKGQAAKVALGP